MAKKANVGCLVAIIIAAVIGIAVLIHLGVAYYFLQSKFTIKEIKTQEAEAAAPVEPSAATPAGLLAASTAQEAESAASLNLPRVTPARLPAANIVTAQKGAFTRDKALDFTGYYFPIGADITSGEFRLLHVDILSENEFGPFEAGKQTLKTFTPFMMSFEDLTSKELADDLGSYRENSPRVFCTFYVLTRESIVFEGFDKQVGKVTFRGKADAAFMAAMNDPETRPSMFDEAALTGDLTIGDKTFKGVKLSYWAGD